MKTLDIPALRDELKQIASDLKEAKKERRCPPGGYSSETLAMKYEATMLCAIRASHRGKVHLQSMSWEEQEKFIQAERERFSLKPAA